MFGIALVWSPKDLMVCFGGTVFSVAVATINPICIITQAVSSSGAGSTPSGISITGIKSPIVAKDKSGGKLTILAPWVRYHTSSERISLVCLYFTEVDAFNLFPQSSWYLQLPLWWFQHRSYSIVPSKIPSWASQLRIQHVFPAHALLGIAYRSSEAGLPCYDISSGWLENANLSFFILTVPVINH